MYLEKLGELVWIMVNIHQVQVYIIVVYRPPSNGTDLFFKALKVIRTNKTS